MNRSTWPGAADARAWAALLFDEPGRVVELRALGVRGVRGPGVVAGYFDDPALFVEAAAKLDGRASGVYATLHELNPALLARAANRLASAPKTATSDADIRRLHWLLIDVDPVRPSGISATAEEQRAAFAVMRRLLEYLAGLGFPDPVKGDSGNGVNGLFRVDLPTTDAALVRRVLEALDARFSTEAARVDLTVHNPSRIAKVYGTLARKGDATADRPHRRSKLLAVPATLDVVPRELLERVAAEAPERAAVPVSAGNGRASSGFDVRALLARHGVEIAREHEISGGATKLHLARCIWNPSHTDDSAYVIVDPGGRLGAGCHHNGCHGKGWREFRDALEPTRGARDNAGPRAAPALPAQSPPAGEPWPDPGRLPEADPTPRLDLDAALPADIAGACRSVAAWIQVAPEAVVTCLLAHLSAAIGNTRWVMARGRATPVSLQIVTSLPSGSGKSETRRYIARATKKIRDDVRRRRAEAIEASNRHVAALREWERLSKNPKSQARVGERPQPPEADPQGGPRATYALTEASMEGVIETLMDTPRGVLWATDEVGTVLGMLGAYGADSGRRSLDAARLRALMDSQPVEAHRAKSNVSPIRRLERPFLAIEADVQPGVLARLFTDEDRVSGMVARILLHAPPPMQGSRQYLSPPPEPEPEVLELLSRRLEAAWRGELELFPDGTAKYRPLPLSPAAEQSWAEECQRLEGMYPTATESEAEGGVLGHARGRILRLAGAVAIMREAETTAVEVLDMGRAIVLMRYFLAHSRRILGLAERPEESAARALARRIEAGDLEDGTNLRDLYRQRWAGLADAESARAACEVLAELGWIRLVEGASSGKRKPGGRRPSPTIRLHPRFRMPQVPEPPAGEVLALPARDSGVSGSSREGAHEPPVAGAEPNPEREAIQADNLPDAPETMTDWLEGPHEDPG